MLRPQTAPINMQSKDNITLAFESLSDMMNSLKELNSILENMPRGTTQLANFKQIRDQVQQTINADITPLWKRLAAHIGISQQIEEGLREMPSEMFGAAAQMLGQSLNQKALDANQLIRETIFNYSILTPIQPSGAHPMSGTMSGLFDMFKTGPTPIIQHTDDENIAKATTAVNYFYNRASQYPDNFPYTSVDDLIAALKAQNSYFMIGFGSAINSIEDGAVGYDDSSLQSTMTKLADTGQGLLPANWMSWFSSVGNDASNPGFWTSIEFTAGATATQAAQGLQSVGSNLLTGLSTASTMLKYLPYIALAGGAIYLYTLAGGHGQGLGNMFSTLKEKAKKAYAK